MQNQELLTTETAMPTSFRSLLERIGQALYRWYERKSNEPARLVDETGALTKLRWLAYAGIFGILLYTLPQGESGFASLAVGFIAAGGSLLVGVLLGFLFGIPRTFQSDRLIQGNGEGQSWETNLLRPEYQANTNLEQISDWLTKILVGVGLTQISYVRQELNTTAAAIATGLGGNAAQSASVALLVYFPVCGFLYGYLWTRMFLAGALQRADRLAGVRNQTEQEAISSATRTMTSLASTTSEEKRGLWVDDHPTKNMNLKQSMERLFHIEFVQSISTDNALEKVTGRQYSVIISDMNRPPDGHAGYTLLDRLQDRHDRTPYIIYSTRADVHHSPEEATSRGAFGCTSSPRVLLELVRKALEQPAKPIDDVSTISVGPTEALKLDG